MLRFRMLSRIKIPCFQQRIKKSCLFLYILLLGLILPTSYCFATLLPGDIAFTGYNSRDPEQFSFIATKNIAGGEIIYFTDLGYCNERSVPGWNNTTEGILKYTVPISGLALGDMIIIGDTGSWEIIVGSGILIKIKGRFELVLGGDQIFAFQTEDTINYAPTFITGIQMNKKTGSTDELWDNIDASNVSTNETDLPSTLTNGTNAVRIYDTARRENAKYKNFITQGSQSEILMSVNNRLNWYIRDNTPYTLGYPTSSTSFASGNWNSVSTWVGDSIPGKTTDVTINHNLTITADCAASDVTVSSGKSLTINTGKTLTIESDASGSGSLIVNGTITGSVSYNRYLTGNKWHLVSSPVSGQEIASFLTNTDNNIPHKENGDYGVMDYNTESNNWNSYFKGSTSGNFSDGKGYCLRRSSDGRITFSGSVLNSMVNSSVSDLGSGWNLVGNPYPSAVKATQTADATNNFITSNITSFDPSYAALYLWDEQAGYTSGRNDYVVINNVGSGSLVQNYVQGGQGFFVKVKSGISTVSFTPAMCTSQPSTPFKAATEPWPSVVLAVHSGEKVAKTTILFHEGMTNGLDVGYDAGVFKAGSDFTVYTRLIENNGVDFMLQCLPLDFEKKFVIPIGLDATELAEVEFSVKANGLPEGIDIVMEDHLTKNLTQFESTGQTYRATLTETGTGRFYLIIGKNVSTNVNIKHNDISIIPNEKSDRIIISGSIQNEAFVSIYNIMGVTVASYTINGSLNALDFSNQQSGIYIIHIKGPEQSISKKIRWNK